MERQRVGSGSPYEPVIGFSRAYRAGRQVFVSGTAPVADGGGVFAPDDMHAQTRRCFEIALAALAGAGGSVTDVVRTRVYLVDGARWEDAARAHGEVFAEVRPAGTFVVVAGLLDPGWLVEVEVDAVLDEAWRVSGSAPR
jgi:enamine deaminase RidA (YjgF/YER057c/UK114 family)